MYYIMSNYQLQEDDHIRSQQFCCLSFIDPVPNYQLHDEECIHEFINNMLNKQSSIIQNISLDEIRADYRVYHSVHYNDIVKTLPEKYHSATHNKGIKIRGVYASLDEAKAQVARLSKQFEKSEPIHIYIAENGKWVPFMTNNLSEQVMDDMNYTLYDYKRQIKESKNAFQKRLNDARAEAKAKKKDTSDENKEDEDEDEDENEEPVYDTIDEYDSTKDYLDEDRVVDNQRYFCVSFIEPSADVEEFMYKTCVKSFIHSYLAKQYDDYFLLHEDENEKHDDFQYSLSEIYEKFLNFKKDKVNVHKSIRVPCFKLRGCFTSEQEASEQSKYLQKIDGSVDIFVGHVGFWLPFAAVNKDDIHSVYNEKGLNEIHTTLKDHKRKIEENKSRLREMNFNPDDTSYGKRKILQTDNIHPVEL